MEDFWKDKCVCVTGGGALIGSHLCEALLRKGVKNLWVADDFSSGKQENIPSGIEYFDVDLREYSDAVSVLEGADICMHLACVHGGRGFVDTHKLDCYENLGLDATVFRACVNRNVEKIVFASSACVYPIQIQQDTLTELLLVENLVNEQAPMRPDGAYGWGKLSAEFLLNAYSESGKIKGVSTRFFTVYGERMKENHAICALIAKSFIKLDPFPIWGDGNQLRNWTYVGDIVNGMILAGEKMDSGVVNIGVEDRFTPSIACEIIWDIMGWRPNKIEYQQAKPVGVVNRIADATKAHETLGWYPRTSFRDGLEKTIEWYVSTHNIEEVSGSLEISLTER